VTGLDTLGIPCSLVFAGTEFSLTNADRVYSAIVKPERLRRITSFPIIHAHKVEPTIDSIVDISDCTIQEPSKQQIQGRNRFAIGIVAQLIYALSSAGAPPMKQQDKQRLLDEAVTAAIEVAAFDIKSKIEDLVANNPKKGLNK
jgi:hypothetical protein